MELVQRLMKDLDVTSEQAAGGAGAVFRLCRARLSDEEFVVIADAVPAISDLMLKAPEFEATSHRGILGWLQKWLGGWAALRLLTAVFAKMELSKTDVARFLDAILQELRAHGSDAAADGLAKAVHR